MAVSHVLSNTVGDWTGTVTVLNSQASTTTIAATNLVRPVDWNSAHNQFYTLSGNTSNASTASGTNVVLQGLGAVTLVGSTGTIGISGPGITVSRYDPFDEAVKNTGQAGQASLQMHPVQLPSVQYDRLGLRQVFTNATNSSGSFTLSNWAGLYTRNVSTLSLVASTSTTHAVTHSGTVGIFSSIGRQRILTIPWTSTLTQGDYWMGLISRSSTAGANCSISQVVASDHTATVMEFSGMFSVSTNATDQRRLGQGFYSVSTTGMPNAIGFSEIQGTATNARNPPIWFLLSQTA